MEIVQFPDRPGVLDLAWGHPRPALLPTRAWAEAFQQTMTDHGWQTLAYGHDPGPGPLVEWLGVQLRGRDGRGPGLAETFVTAGASHALELACLVLTRPGDVVLVDAPTYHLAFRVMLDHGVELVTAATDHDGPVPEAVADQVAALRGAGRRVPMLYLVPTFGNPTGRSVPGPRRAELVDLAGRAELTLVEDDTYRELFYEGSAPPSLWSLATHEHVVRLGSFAKTVAPGLRLGWVNAAPEFVRRLVRLGYVHSGGGVNHATALAMATFGASGAYEAHVESVRRAYAGQRDALVDALVELPGDIPAGGWFLWRHLPAGLTARDLLPVAERHGVSFAEGDLFHADGVGGAHHVRLSFSMLDPDELAEAGTRLSAAVAEMRAAAGPGPAKAVSPRPPR